MSTKTTNFEFIKPEKTDPADITSTNENWDKIDDKLLKLEQVFIAKYNITTIAEVRDAIDAGKVVFCLYEDKYIPLVEQSLLGFSFEAYISNVCYKLTLITIGGWSTNNKYMGYNYGTFDPTPGTSELETGKLYFVYE